MSLDTLDALPLAPRKGYGSAGKPSKIGVNAYNVTKFPDIIVHHYDVAITPGNPPLPAKVGREIFALLSEQEGKFNAFGGIPAVYDGKKNCYSPKVLPFGLEKTFEVDLGAPGGQDDSGGATTGAGEQRGGKSRKFAVKFNKVAEVNLHELAQHFARPVNPNQPPPQLSSNLNLQSTINALQLVLIHTPFMLFTNQKTSFFPDPAPIDKSDLGRGIDMWRGFSTSLRPGPGRLIINVDLAALPMVHAGNLIEVCCLHLGRRTPNGNELANLQDRERIELERLLKGVTIAVQGKEKDGSPRIRKYKIKAIERVPANKDMFEFRSVKNGKEVTEQISVATYFEREMNRRLQFPTLPAVRGSNTAKLPMEVCQIELRQKWTRKLTPEQTRNALSFTQKVPTERMGYVRQGINHIYPDNAQSVPRMWGVELDKSNMITIAARQLQAPKLTFSGTVNAMEGQWNMRNLKYNQPSQIQSWVPIVFDDRLDDQKMMECMKALAGACTEAGMRVPPPQQTIRWNSRADSRDIIGFLKKHLFASKPQVIICFLPNNSGWQYSQIKRFGDCDTGTVTQCMATIKFAKRFPNQSYWANVALKLNVKLGGKNHILAKESLGIFGEMPTILFGADVNHPGPDSLSPSVAALVGTLDPQAAAYGTQIRIQSSRVEMINDLQEMVRNLLQQFYQKNKMPPKRIIFFRDGVSEGQFQQCLRDELPKIRAACVSINPGYKPQITFIVVGKRHNFRFFPLNQADADKSGNVRAGTVIDQAIISPFENDFYLNSHAGLLGTSKPSHYTVIHDDAGFSADQVQTLAYNLCYSYARSTRSVSIVTPAYYSHHVAYRAKLLLAEGETDEVITSVTGSKREAAELKRLGEYQRRMPTVNKLLADKLYFL